MMTNLDLQEKCHLAAVEYMDEFWPNLRNEDLVKYSHLLNAVAAGYAMGWQDKVLEIQQAQMEINKNG